MSYPPKIMMPEIVKGVEAAAMDAIVSARRAGTKLVVWIDGKTVEITPDEAEKMLSETEAKSTP